MRTPLALTLLLALAAPAFAQAFFPLGLGDRWVYAPTQSMVSPHASTPTTDAGSSTWTADAGPAAGALALTAGPNPVRAATTLRFALPAASDVRLAVVDALGRTVRRLDLGARPAGADDAVLSAGGLAPGVYTVRLDAGARSTAVRVVVP